MSDQPGEFNQSNPPTEPAQVDGEPPDSGPVVNDPVVSGPVVSGPAEGWYADPHEPQRLRYWDGSTWTEYVHDQVPFAPPVPAPIAARRVGPHDGSVNDIGEWLRSSFRVAVSNLVPSVALLLLPLIPFLIAVVMMFRVVSSASDVADEAFNDGLATTESFFTSNFDFSSLAVMGVSVVVGLILLAVVQVGLSHLLHGAHVGEPTGFGRALGAGLRKGWRLLGWYVVLYFAISAAMAAGVGLVILAAQLSSGLAVAVGALLYIALLVVGTWLGVRLVMLPVACAVAPSGSSALSATLAATKGRFLAVLGRVMLVGLLSYLIILPFQFAVFSFFPNLVDAQALEELDPELVTPRDFLEPLATAFGVMALLYMIAFLLYQIFYSSAMARLYADLGGLDPRS